MPKSCQTFSRFQLLQWSCDQTDAHDDQGSKDSNHYYAHCSAGCRHGSLSVVLLWCSCYQNDHIFYADFKDELNLYSSISIQVLVILIICIYAGWCKCGSGGRMSEKASNREKESFKYVKKAINKNLNNWNYKL